MTVLVGVDPGSITGVVALDFPASVLGWNWAQARLLGTWTVRRPDPNTNRTEAEADAELGYRLRQVFAQVEPNVIVFEEPMDVSDSWHFKGAGRGGRHTKRGTGFRIGAVYGIAVAAAHFPTRRIYSYPVHDFGKRPGWMGPPRTPREVALRRAGLIAGSLDRFRKASTLTAAPLEPWSEHALCALGVCLHHTGQLAAAGVR
jgi:hypothetical protein